MITFRNKIKRRWAFLRAATLVELQMGMAVLVLVIGAAVGSNVFGLRMFYQTRMNLEATDESRKVLGNLREEIRGCTIVQVGTGTHLAFKEIPDDTRQIGNALQIFPGTNTNSYIIYCRYTDDTVRKWSTTTKRLETLAHNVTNVAVFSARSYDDLILTNNENNRVIEIDLKFLQQRGKNATQRGGLHNYYQIKSKATRRKVL